LQRRDFILTKRCTPSVQKMSFFNKRCFIIWKTIKYYVWYL
jgi:hypothetical protein